jgi:hypothetical protein
MFCLLREPIGVLEVEDYRHVWTAKKIGTFFEGRYKEIQLIQFGILVTYTYELIGNGSDRAFPSAIVEEALNEVREVTKRHPSKPVIVIAVDKSYEKCARAYDLEPNTTWANQFKLKHCTTKTDSKLRSSFSLRPQGTT